MGEDESEQPLTEHLVDQFASYFLITMVAFHLVGYMKKQYEKRYSEKWCSGKRHRDDV
jgi:Zn-dependent peptidase ImmA (M78 family)